MKAFGSHGEDTGLDSLLKENKIDSIFCCGLAYDICVGETALSGAKLGYQTYLIADASKDRLKLELSGLSMILLCPKSTILLIF